MKRLKIKYNFINLFILLITAGIYLYDYGTDLAIFRGKDIRHILIIITAVAAVHLIKAGRLYLALYGLDISLSTYIKIYCKVTPVSVVIPYKLGEFFRMYCYGSQLGNMLKGIIIVLLDRFMDTTALVTMILLVWIVNGGYVAKLVYILLVFLFFTLLVYFVFPGVYKFWKKYLLGAKATENKLAILKILDTLNAIYQEIINVSKGRGVILYFLSLTAWGIEIGSLVLLSGITREEKSNQTISKYLSSAMGTGVSTELKQFVFVSVILLIVIYIVIKGMEMVIAKKEY